MFTDDFLESLPSDPEWALMALCEEFQKRDAAIEMVDDGELQIDLYLEAYAAFEAFVDAFGLDYLVPELVDDEQSTVTRIRAYAINTIKAIKGAQNDKKFSDARSKYRARFGSGFIYEFSDGDLSRIQTLLNELRDEIERSELFDAKHKQRLFSKLESLQLELHKKISSLDKFWGLIGDAGIVLGKFGKDAKPFVDRVKEIAQIIWRTQARAEELPSGTTLPLLTSGEAEQRDDA